MAHVFCRMSKISSFSEYGLDMIKAPQVVTSEKISTSVVGLHFSRSSRHHPPCTRIRAVGRLCDYTRAGANFHGTSLSVVAERTAEGGIGKEKTEKESDQGCSANFSGATKMGYGREEKTRNQPSVEVVERGEIFFFYRPKVEKEEAHSRDDVQRLYIVLRPESGETSVQEKQDSHSGKEGRKLGTGADDDKSAGPSDKDNKADEGGHGTEKIDVEKQPLLRFIVMGKKSLPDPSEKRGRPYWGFVELVTTRIEDVKAALKGEEYDTATRGHRHTETARALAEGVYRILRHNPGKRMHTHLVYKLEYPPEDVKNEAQESLNVEREGSFLIQIKNPDQHGLNKRFQGLQNKRRAVFPAHLQGRFGHRQYNPADPPDFLNYEGCEFLLIAASDDIEEELGLELKTEVENSHDPSCSDLVKTFGETAASIRPLLEGSWT